MLLAAGKYRVGPSDFGVRIAHSTLVVFRSCFESIKNIKCGFNNGEIKYFCPIRYNVTSIPGSVLEVAQTIQYDSLQP